MALDPEVVKRLKWLAGGQLKFDPVPQQDIRALLASWDRRGEALRGIVALPERFECARAIARAALEGQP